ncbi:MAG: hypothetical protein AAGD06_25540 [Acidobacteriota bacterium]
MKINASTHEIQPRRWSLRVGPPGFGAALILAAVVSSMISPAPALAGDLIFADGFESGGVDAWSQQLGYVPTTAFRISDLDLRDPHLFVDTQIFGCVDFTDQDLPLGFGPSFNGALETALTTDGDGDGFLDESSMFLFKPLLELAQGETVEQRDGQCTAPIASTVCVPEPGSSPAPSAYDGLAAGTCLGPVAGTTSGYSPAVGDTVGPCFVTEERDITFMLQGVELVLRDARSAAGWIGAPPNRLENGLLRGFLPETVADSLLLPADLPLVGGQPFSILLPGGTGNCAPGDDRDQHEGESGWWFYLELVADEVPYSE